MPERDNFPSEYFDGNPYETETPEGTYRRIRWGNEPSEVFSIEAPEPLATLGDVAQICTQSGSTGYSEDEAPFLALGTVSNRLYMVPKIGKNPVDIPDGPYEYVGTVIQLDYYSDKGGEEAYYFHEHEPPYPRLYMHLESGVCILEPQQLPGGGRSYAVGDEGVIG